MWHLHVHVFPRYADDQLYARHADSAYVSPEARTPFAERLAETLALPRIFLP